eukprot:GHRR01017926.1.p1 GENE.GHRR01017926.1~~GHRR01017926.1.p1  ORF type:complete len:450 (+),score=189.71 GHRR01017926.1:171-1520(+)
MQQQQQQPQGELQQMKQQQPGHADRLNVGYGKAQLDTLAPAAPSEGGNTAAAVTAVSAASWPIPPTDMPPRIWQKAAPMMLQVSGGRVSVMVHGWRTGPGCYLLQQPAKATWGFSPELARLTLSQFNPLLEGVVLVEGNHTLHSSYAPAGGQLPAQSGKLYISPMKVVVAQGQLLKQVYTLLNTVQGTGFKKPSWLPINLSNIKLPSSSSTTGSSDNSCSSSGSKSGVEVWSGPLHVTLLSPGVYRTERVDMIVGSQQNGIRVALWGRVDTNAYTVDMIIGLPAITLSQAGIKNLPDSYMLPLAVTGSLSKPQIDWPAAMRKLAVLSAMQLGCGAWQQQQPEQQRQQQQGLAGLLPGLFGAANKALSTATSSFLGQVDERLQQELLQVPPPVTEQLPWEQQEQRQQQQQTQQLEQEQQEAKGQQGEGQAAEVEQDTAQPEARRAKEQQQ